MGLATCADCGNGVSELALACPRCGRPQVRPQGTSKAGLPDTWTRAGRAYGQWMRQRGYSDRTTAVVFHATCVALSIVIPLVAVLPFYWFSISAPPPPPPVRMTSMLNDARSHAAAGDTDAAIASYGEAQHVAELSSADVAAYSTLLVDRAARTLAAGNIDSALADYRHAHTMLPDDTQIMDAITSAEHVRDTGIKQKEHEATLQAQRQAEEGRPARVAEGLAAAEHVLHDKSACDSPRDIADAWSKLKDVRKTDAVYHDVVRITPKLEECRLASMKRITRDNINSMGETRKNIRQLIDTAFLDSGMDVDVRVSGPNNTLLTLSHTLLGSRAVVRKFTDGTTLLQNLRDVGFRKVTFQDRFGNGQYWDLKPDSESHAGAEVLARLGIGDPLELR